MRCPVCDKLEYGQVGNGQYYCWNCYLEFHGQPGKWRFFAVDEEGGLVELAARAREPAQASVVGDLVPNPVD